MNPKLLAGDSERLAKRHPVGWFDISFVEKGQGFKDEGWYSMAQPLEEPGHLPPASLGAELGREKCSHSPGG